MFYKIQMGVVVLGTQNLWSKPLDLPDMLIVVAIKSPFIVLHTIKCLFS